MRFALLGASGYVAPRHFKAIKETGNELVAALDPHDAAGALDRYFPDCRFFLDENMFWNWIADNPVEWVSVCTPTSAHAYGCGQALRARANVICEKPVALSPALLDLIAEQETVHAIVHPLLQLRHHPIMAKMEAKVEALRAAGTRIYILVRYGVYRGPWYDESWKGDELGCGGVLADLGVHLFDALHQLMGRPEDVAPSPMPSQGGAQGKLTWASGQAVWTISRSARNPCREFEINGEVFDCSSGFEDLHTRAYEEILAGTGPDLRDARKAIELIERLR